MPHLSTRLCALFALVTLGTLVLPTTSEAQQVRRKFKDKIHVIQPKPVLQKGRMDVAPRIGYTINDSLWSTMKVGAEAKYHFSERLFLGAMFDWYQFGNTISGPTDNYLQILAQTNSAPDSPVVNFMGGLELGWVPIFGKFSIFNSGIVFYDFSVSIGAGWVDHQSIQLTSSQGGVGVTLAITNHIFINDWMSLNLGVRDVSFFGRLQGADSVLSHAVTADLGVGFYFPSATREGAEASK